MTITVEQAVEMRRELPELPDLEALDLGREWSQVVLVGSLRAVRDNGGDGSRYLRELLGALDEWDQEPETRTQIRALLRLECLKADLLDLVESYAEARDLLGRTRRYIDARPATDLGAAWGALLDERDRLLEIADRTAETIQTIRAQVAAAVVRS